MKLTTLIIALFFLIAGSYAQKQQFDIASFIPPKGWQRIDSNGSVLFQNMKTNNGLTSFCQIFLFPSQASSGDPSKDFSAGWKRLIAKQPGAQQNPKTTTQKMPDGWVQTSAYTNVKQQGITYTSMLISLSGYGKVMSVLVNFAGQDFMNEVQVFFQNLDLRTAYITGDLQSGDKAPETKSAGLSDYVYTAPAGWSTKVNTDGIVMTAPDHGSERCVLTIWPMRSSGNDIWTDAGNIYAEVFREFEPRNDGFTPNSIVRGLSPQGWEYVIIKRDIGIRGYGTMYGFIFLAKLGNLLAPISGISKDPMVSACFGLLMNDVWPKFFYSLQFRNWRNSGTGITKQIIGEWIGGGATAAGKYTFAPNGRYGDAMAAQQYAPMANGEVLTSTQAYFGNGSYSIKGNQITLISDSRKNSPEIGYLRLEQESIDNGRNWTEKLYLLRISAIDGKEYEVNFKRNR
ncbi:MAG: hypothetical protein ACHQEM_08105 [Chitinophagales bacterium]